MIYTTKDGDHLDAICMKYCGKTVGMVETMLYNAANYALAATEIFSAGTVINLLAISASETLLAQEGHILGSKD